MLYSPGVSFLDPAEMHPGRRGLITRAEPAVHWLVAGGARPSRRCLSRDQGLCQPPGWYRRPSSRRQPLARSRFSRLSMLPCSGCVRSLSCLPGPLADRRINCFGRLGLDRRSIATVCHRRDPDSTRHTGGAPGRVRFCWRVHNPLGNRIPACPRSTARAHTVELAEPLQPAEPVVRGRARRNKLARGRAAARLFAAGVWRTDGKYLDDNRPEGARLTLFPQFARYTGDSGVRAEPPLYVDIALRHGLDPAQMAIAYAVSRPFAASVIIGATTMEQLRTNTGAVGELTLDDRLVAEMEPCVRACSNPCP